ncbi:amino acid permease [Candidatus Babeliales bacterium]|nr:amino acid permease [Candidatus Babeliales bacterium]
MKRNVSLLKACLIVTNLMVGAGVFINIKPLTAYAGPWGFLGYLIGVVIFLPVIISLSTLASIHAVAGGLLVYGKEYLHSAAGFLSAWSYFVGKSVSAALLSYVLIAPLYMNWPAVHFVPQWVWTYGFMVFIVLLNIVGVRLGGHIQWLFTAIKIVPFVAVISAGAMRGGWAAGGLWSMSYTPDIISIVPIALFALSGFEVICSIGHMIKNPERNARIASIGTALVVAAVYGLFQFCTYVLAGDGLAMAIKPLEYIAAHLPNGIGNIIDDFMLASVFSGAFSIITNNCWNLYALAKEDYFPGSKFLTRLTGTGVPWLASFVQVAVACVILSISVDQISLQNMSVFAMVLAFWISTIAAFVAFWKNPKISWIIPAIGIVTCAYILFLCFQRLIEFGVSISFLSVYLFGVVVALAKYLWDKKNNSKNVLPSPLNNN